MKEGGNERGIEKQRDKGDKEWRGDGKGDERGEKNIVL